MELQKTYVIVKLTNSEQDFVENWNKIRALHEKDKSAIDVNAYENFYCCYLPEGINSYGALVNKVYKEFDILKTVDILALPLQYGICLWIEDCAGNDIIEYQYLALMLQQMSNVIAYIYPQYREDTQKVYSKVTSFFSFFIQKGERRERIWIQQEEKKRYFIGMLKQDAYFDSYKITPILEFDEEGEERGDKRKEWGTDLEMWTRTVGELLEECEDLEKIKEIESYRELVTELHRSKSNNTDSGYTTWLKKENELNELCRKSFNNRFLCRCIDCFVSSADSKSKKSMEESRKVFWSEEIQNFLVNMPIIAFYMLCIQIHFLKDRKSNFKENVELLLVNAEAITEGVIQILENLHHSSERRGLFSIRVHEKRDVETDYMSRKYKEMFEDDPAKFFFEFRVLDYSTRSIVESFRDSQKNNRIAVPEDMAIRTFFEHVDDMKFWDDYNKVPENLIHHYGLQIFSNIVSNNGGYFCVTSSSKSVIDLEQDRYCNHNIFDSNVREHIPGTECVILIPLQKDVEQINPSVDADIQYSFDFGRTYRIRQVDFSEDAVSIVRKKEEGLVGQRIKEWRIGELKNRLVKQFEEDEENKGDVRVSVLSAESWKWTDIEVYCKALMLYLVEKVPTEEQGFYLIIQGCSPNVFIAVTRLFAIFYGKDELSNYMEHVQIYLSGKDPSEEFLIAGKDISSLLTIARKMTLVRGIQPQCLYSIEYILNKFRKKSVVNADKVENLSLIPFDMLKVSDTEVTLFEQAVKKVLESDIQKYSFGCKIRNTHMRIGSKLHMDEFYEAELLFHNNYYVSRFALLLERDMYDVLEKKSPIMFVGYETYSELLLYDLVKNLNGKGYDSSYMIYEGRETGRFRYYNSSEYIRSKDELIYVVIVPINSTMTTHSKIRAALSDELQKVSPGQKIKKEINYALIVVGPEKEDDIVLHYYKFRSNNVLEAKYLPEGECDIRYFVTVKTEWRSPLICEKCFPKKSMLDEQPLIETNRVSIIPVQMLGLQEAGILQEVEKSCTEVFDKDNLERVKRLEESLIYRHIARKGNHFIFYFELEKYFMQNRKQIIEWLQKKKSEQKKAKGIIYDVIVAPLHYSNAGFVTEVNSHLYGNAALVLNFEVEKEYRDNVKTKYSNIIGLYKKLLDIGKEAELRFHFVDDNIITGNTYMRAKSLFSSLFPYEQEGPVKVTIFKDVIVMLNRMSRSSIRSCIGDCNEYHAFVSLNISAMRNHEDACTQCKVVENAQKLREQAATNQMYEFWERKIYQHRTINADCYEEEIRDEHLPEKEKDERLQKEKRERAGRRMLCTHMFNDNMGKIGHKCNDTEVVRGVMLELLKSKNQEKNGKEQAMEWVISCIKVFSRPFVCFRKSSREAIFQIMLELLEFMTSELILSYTKIKNSKFQKYGEIKEVCCIIRDAKWIWGQDQIVYSLLLTLMQRLSDLGSNYLIRKENIKKLFRLVEHLNISVQQREDFKQRYLSMLKRITCLSSDENKCIYLDYLLLFGEEYESEQREKENLTGVVPAEFSLINDFEEEQCRQSLLNAKDFQRIAFIENTRVMYDGIRDLADEMGGEVLEEDVWKQIREKYYYGNFERVLKYYGLIKEDGEQMLFVGGEAVCALVKLYSMLNRDVQSEEDTDVEKFYNNFLEFVEVISGAQGAKMIFSYNTDGVSDKKVYKKQRDMEIEIEEDDYQMLHFLYDTYAISKEEGTTVYIKYRNYVGRGYSAQDRNPMNTVYLELNFGKEINEITLMIALKCIMVFRNLIVKKLEKDFSNNLMQKWSAELNFKRHMKLERATDHTAKDELAEDFEMLVGNMDGCEVTFQKALFNLVINSYIARMNVQLLADALPEGENEEYLFESLYRYKLRALIERLRVIEDKLEIIDENGKHKFSKTVRDAKIRMYNGKKRRERLSMRRLSVVIIELIRSAIKYSDDCRVYIYRENKYLVVKNSFKSKKTMEVINRDIKDAYSRKRDGISLAVIKELIDKFYELDETEAVKIIAEEEEDSVGGKIKKRKYYYVKLPILEE